MNIQHSMTHLGIARQQLGKHIPEAYALNNRMTSIARQQTNKRAFLTIRGGVSVGSVPRTF
jgi:hypothetical protein